MHAWFVLPDGKRVSSDLITMPRRGDVVRFAFDGEAYEVAQIEHVSLPHAPRHLGNRLTNLVVQLRASDAG
jgi:hypothetical protein